MAKILSKWAKDSAVFTFKAGIVEGHVIAVKDIEALSNLPSKEELISKIMFLINSGAQRLAVATAGVARNLALVLEQIRAQKESQAGGDQTSGDQTSGDQTSGDQATGDQATAGGDGAGEPAPA